MYTYTYEPIHTYNILILGERHVTGKPFANRDRYMLVYTYMHTCIHTSKLRMLKMFPNRDRYMLVY
jgi:hypothetical protein